MLWFGYKVKLGHRRKTNLMLTTDNTKTQSKQDVNEYSIAQ